MAFEFVNNQTVVSLFIKSVERYTYIRFHIRSIKRRTNWKTEEAGIARKTHEIASLEQSFSQRPIDSISNNLYKVPFAGHTRAMNSVRG